MGTGSVLQPAFRLARARWIRGSYRILQLPRASPATFLMLTRDDVQRLAELARLAIDPDEADQTLPRLNAVFGLIEQLQAAEVSGVEPLVHPGADPKLGTRLRTDTVTEKVDRSANQVSAPKVADGLYLVPRVVE